MTGVCKKERFEEPAVGGVYVPSMVVMAMVLLSFSLHLYVVESAIFKALATSKSVANSNLGSRRDVQIPNSRYFTDRNPEQWTRELEISNGRVLKAGAMIEGSGALDFKMEIKALNKDEIGAFQEDVEKCLRTLQRVCHLEGSTLMIGIYKDDRQESLSMWDITTLHPFEHEAKSIIQVHIKLQN